MDESWDQRAYRIMVVCAYGIVVGSYVWVIADHLTEGELSRWSSRCQAQARRQVASRLSRWRLERETKRQAGHVIFAAMEILDSANDSGQSTEPG